METGICNICDEHFPLDELRSVGTQILCEDCYENNTVSCERCGERILNDDNAGSSRYPLCQSCSENFIRCSVCDSLIRSDEANFFGSEEEAYCAYCFSEEERHRDEDEDETTWIRSYSYKPTPIFYGIGPRFYGLELELSNGGYHQGNAKRILDIANRESELIYIKADGSLDEGFEIVTHPMSYEALTTLIPWKKLLHEAIEMGYVGHNSSCAGLHLHVSRLALGETSYECDEVVSHIIYFFEKQWDQILCFSRRSISQMEKWSKRYGYKDQPKEILDGAKCSPNGRYSCINLLCPDTIEIRVFRSSLRLNTIFAALQFVDAICDAAIYLTDEEMQNLSWQQFVKDLDTSKRKELIEYLKIRQLYVNEKIECEEV